jgi:dTDP-4-amino-4,6-dideoxygalactose transaminase
MERSGYLDRFVKYYNGAIIDMPDDYLEEMTKVEARVGLVQIKKYQDIVDRRRKIAKHYDSHLQGIPKLILPPLINGATYSHYCPRTLHRQQIIEFILKHGIQLGQIIDYNIPEMPVYQIYSGSKKLYPIASEMTKTTVNLPVWGTGYMRKLVKLLHTLVKDTQE